MNLRSSKPPETPGTPKTPGTPERLFSSPESPDNLRSGVAGVSDGQGAGTPRTPGTPERPF